MQELSAQLQTQEKQAEGLLEELHLMTSVASPQSLQSLAADGVRLHELVCAARQHISEMRVQAQRDIKALHRYWLSQAYLLIVTSVSIQILVRLGCIMCDILSDSMFPQMYYKIQHL